MPSPIIPAELAFDEAGIPYSPRFDDVYHSADGALGQARHVFLNGNDLPQRWRERCEFTIVETGFGLGLNFLATWLAWRDDPLRAARLHFVSIEKHPFRRTDLKRLYHELIGRANVELAALAPLAAHLASLWPDPLLGLHRLHLAPGLTLSVVFGDLRDVLPTLRAGADAFYLDGFSPAKNPDMWTLPTFKALARLARDGATLATYTAAGDVRRGLTQAGFEMEKRTGYARKRTMLAGRFMPRWRVRRHDPPTAADWPQRHAMVIGAGLAGTALCHRLAARGWRVTLFERHAGPAGEASGNPLGIFHPQLSRDDNALARLTRAGFLYGLTHWHTLAIDMRQAAPRWQCCGILQLDDDLAHAIWADWLHEQRYPAEYARAVDAAEAATLTGLPLPRGGLWFAHGGWIDPVSVCRAQLAAAGPAVDARFGVTIAALERHAGGWLARDHEGRPLATAPVAIVANADQAGTLLAPWLDAAALPLQRIRGQLTLLDADRVPALTRLRAVISGDGYVAPMPDGRFLCGATYDTDDDDASVRVRDHRANLGRLAALLPSGMPMRLDSIDPARLAGRTAFRCIAPDRLPMVGALPDMAGIRAALATQAGFAGAHLRELPRLAGLYGSFAFGSRGLLWAALAAEQIASQIEGEPLPLEAALCDAIDPARYVLRMLRHGALNR